MYSSLRKIDIVTTAPDGRRLLIQTDHRRADEVDADADLSVIFALTRILMPLWSDQGKDAKVRYAALEEHHPRLAEVAAATGAELEVAGKITDLTGVPQRPPGDLADHAFAQLGRAVFARDGLTVDEAGLAALEASCAGAPSEEDDEIAYWTTVAELAAATGEVMRAVAGGRWVDAPEAFRSDIPFLFQAAGDSSLSNAVGKAIKFLQHGDGESPRQLLRALEDRGAPDGPLLVNLKPAAWGGASDVVCEPMFPGMNVADADMPLVAYGRDRPNTFALFMRKEPHDLAGLRQEAVANLAGIEVEVERLDLETLKLWVVSGSFFAAEKLLDVAFMRRMHQEVGAELLAAAVPEKGRLLLTSALQPPAAVLGFVAVARGSFERNEGGRQVSPTVFLVSNGEVNGIARPEAPPKKKGFFSRLFN